MSSLKEFTSIRLGVTGGIRDERGGRLLERAISRTAHPPKKEMQPLTICTKEEIVTSRSPRGSEVQELKRTYQTIVPPIRKEWR